MTNAYWKTSASQKSAELTRQLHLMIRDGKGETDEADEVREQAAKLWSKLSAEEQRRVRRLSAELAMLYDDEVPRPKPKLSVELERLNRQRRNGNRLKDVVRERQDKARKDIRQWHLMDNWEPILESLRVDPGLLAPPQRAAYRGRAYQHFGDYETAMLFFKFALERDPGHPINTSAILQLLADMGRLQEAGEMAEGIVADLGSPPVLLVLAALILMRPPAPDIAVPGDVLRRVIEICNLALTRSGESLQHAHISMINSTIGNAYAELGELEKAREYYEQAYRQSSDDPAALLYLGRIRYSTAPERAVEYLQKATRLDPNLGLAHKILAHYFLQIGKPDLAIIESTEAIRCSPNDHEKAIILAWRAIGTIRAGGAISDARKDFAEAMRIGPDIAEVLQYHQEFVDFDQKMQRGEKKQATALLADRNLFSNAAELVSDSAYRLQITAGTVGRLAALFSEAETAGMLAN